MIFDFFGNSSNRSEILPSVTLTKRYDLIWGSWSGVQTPHGTRIRCEKSFNGLKSWFFHFYRLLWCNCILKLVHKSMSNTNLELWPHMGLPRCLWYPPPCCSRGEKWLKTTIQGVKSLNYTLTGLFHSIWQFYHTWKYPWSLPDHPHIPQTTSRHPTDTPNKGTFCPFWGHWEKRKQLINSSS